MAQEHVEEGSATDGPGGLRFAELLVANAFDGVYIIRGQRYVYVNQRFADILGYPVQTLTSADFHFDVLLTERGKALMDERFERRQRGESVSRRYDIEARRGDGAIIEVEVSVTELDAVTEVSVLGVVRDVTAEREARRALQQARADLARQVEQRTAQLASANASLRDEVALHERTNADLRRFVDVAAHDLQEPLRMVSLYSRLLLEECGQELDEVARGHAQMAEASARRMHALIRDLQVYTALGIRTRRREPTCVQEAIRRALAQLSELVRESKAAITCGDLPTVHADPQMMHLLFTALLGNALKYRSEDAPEIEVNARRSKQGWLIDVTDNGVGIDPHYKERVFEVFERLRSTDRYPGTGIGLAICRKIAILHGGDVEVVSTLGRGSTFTITLPDDAEPVGPEETIAS